MQDRRRKILVNQYEVASHEALQEATARSGARVFPKVRIADALSITASGLSNEEYSYALRAHFDIAIERPGEAVAFAVEFDGPHHDTDPKSIVADGLKNSICTKLGMPLLRVDAGFLRRVGRFTVLGWLAEVWFLGHDFAEAQERGEVAPDEFFDPRFILFEFENPTESFPYDPFLPHRAYVDRMAQKGHCSFPGEELIATDPQGYVVALTLIEVPGNRTLIGLGRCRAFQFWPVSAHELAQDWAWVDAAEKLRAFQRGHHTGATVDEVHSWRRRIDQWKQFP